MPLGAMRLGSLPQPRFTSPSILRCCHRLHVLRVLARTIAAQVVDHEANGDRPDLEFVGVSVGGNTAASHGEGSIPASISTLLCACPRPTGVRPARGIYLRPKARGGWLWLCYRNVIRCIPAIPPAHVMRLTPRARLTRAAASIDRAGGRLVGHRRTSIRGDTGPDVQASRPHQFTTAAHRGAALSRRWPRSAAVSSPEVWRFSHARVAACSDSPGASGVTSEEI